MCSERAPSTDGEMSSCLSCVQPAGRSQRWRLGRRDHSQPPITLLQPPCFSSLSISFALSPPPLLLGGDQVIKHRLQRLLRPQKEERRSRPQSSTVATVGLEEMKSKVCSNCTLLVHASCACFSTRSQRISLGQQDF